MQIALVLGSAVATVSAGADDLVIVSAGSSVRQTEIIQHDVDQKLLDELGLFSAEARITGGKQEHRLRLDLGRKLADEARRTVRERCVQGSAIQLVVGDSLSAAAAELIHRVKAAALRNWADGRWILICWTQPCGA